MWEILITITSELRYMDGEKNAVRKGKVRLLLIDDDRDFLELEEKYLSEWDDDLEITVVDDGIKGLELLDKDEFDVVISDHMMPVMKGLDLLRTIREYMESDIPFIMVTGVEEIKKNALDLGADRFFGKNDLSDRKFKPLVDAIKQVCKKKWCSKEAEMLKFIFNSSYEGFYIRDIDGDFSYVNSSFADLHGYSRKELIGMNSRYLLTDGCRKRIEDMDEKSLFETHHEIQIVTKTGDIRTLENMIFPIYDDEGEPTEIFGLSRDITEKKRAEETESRLRALQSTVRKINQIIVHEDDVDKLVEDVLEVLLDKRDYIDVTVAFKEDGIIAPSAHNGPYERGRWFFPSQGNAPRCIEDVIRSKESKYICSVKQRCDDCDHCKHLEDHKVILTPMVLKGEIAGVLWVCLPLEVSVAGDELELLREIGADIAYARSNILSRIQLLESEEIYRGMFENTKDVVIIVDSATGMIVDANPALMNIFGYPPKSVKNKKLSDLDIFKGTIQGSTFLKMVDEGLFDDYRFMTLKSQCGDTIPVELVCGKYDSAYGETLRINIRDISVLREREKELGTMYYLLKMSGEKDLSLDDIFRRTVAMIPDTFQYPGISEAKLSIDGKEFKTEGYTETEWKLDAVISVDGKARGLLEIVYLKEKPERDQGPFVKWEVELLEGVVVSLSRIIHQREVEDKLRFHSDILAQANSAVIATDMEGKITFWNPKAEELFGWSPQEVMGRRLQDITPSILEIDKAKEITDLLCEGETWIGEIAVKRRDGKELIVLLVDSPILDNEGEWVGAVGVSTDVTEQKELEEQLEGRYLFEETTNTILSRLINCDRQDFEQAIQEVLEVIGVYVGADRAYLLSRLKTGTSFDDVYEWSAESVPHLGDNMKHLCSSDQTWWLERLENDSMINISDPEELQLEAKNVYVTLQALDIKSMFVLPVRIEGELVGFVGLGNTRSKVDWSQDDRDLLSYFAEVISGTLHRHQGESALEASERLFRSLFVDSPLPIIIHDKDTGEIIDANPRAYRKYGFTSSEELKKDQFWYETPYSLQNPSSVIKKAYDKGSYKFEWCRSDGCGKRYWDEVHLSPVSIAGKDGVIATCIDLTVRKYAEEREEFLYTLLRHDIKNKMQIIRGYLELLHDEVDDSGPGLGYLKSALTGITDSTYLIDKLGILRLANEEEIEKVNIESIILSAVESMRPGANKNGMDIEIKCPEDESYVEGGPLLKEVFSNIIENAIRYSNGTLIRVTGDHDEEYIRCVVEDDGDGIPEEYRAKVFHKGFTTDNSKGMGLGLYIARVLIDTYGGAVEVMDSELGGARFDIKMKLYKDKPHN